MPPVKRRTAKSVSTKTAELAMAVPQVVAHRLTRMALAGATPSVRDRKEFERMVAEKRAAFSDACHAMAKQTARAQLKLASSLWQSLGLPVPGRRPAAGALAAQMHRAVLLIAGKGIGPVHRKAVANARRLARTKLR